MRTLTLRANQYGLLKFSSSAIGDPDCHLPNIVFDRRIRDRHLKRIFRRCKTILRSNYLSCKVCEALKPFLYISFLKRLAKLSEANGLI